jgi:hypothetical protein
MFMYSFFLAFNNPKHTTTRFYRIASADRAVTAHRD